MQSCSQFKLEALTSLRSIRPVVLRRSAKKDSIEEPLSCHFVEASVDCSPSYVALSDTWGGEEPCEPLIIQNAGPAERQLLMTPNCAAALRLLRRSLSRKMKSRSSLSVWVDAICIDQSSNDERNAQVAMMAEIYQRAKTVVVWLGEDHAPATWGSLACSKPLALFSRLRNDRDLNEGVKSLAARIALKVGEVFRDATRLMVEEEDSLRVLYFSNRQKTMAGVAWETMPSWTVDFATTDSEVRGSYKYYYTSLCAASGGTKPYFAFSGDGKRLTLRVVRVGQVGSFVSDNFPTKSQCVGGRCVVDDQNANDEDKDSGSKSPFPHSCENPYLDVLGRFMTSVTRTVWAGPKLHAMGRSLYELLWWIMQGPKKISSLVEWDSLRCGCQCRVELRLERLFFTCDRRAGFGVVGVRERDFVCLLAGLDHPFILRPCKGEAERFTLDGPAVFAGVMSGESWPTGVDELEDLEIV
ncbi:HET domain-containing protein [Colletotrichum orchidophilum]|uniref:HET domain-containing protein n=1 Tax=Colletotrichum orchidophilum TaxID=1209926 RepID=A0A1G4BAE3_9PEZI|nr:HET domain-containing protein [Colletotrichum orchidophilum]OHE98305.1 HET domain-containing protein [Colletotrichum orchidophilum]